MDAQLCHIDGNGHKPGFQAIKMNASVSPGVVLPPAFTQAGHVSAPQPTSTSFGLLESQRATERRRVARGSALFRKGDGFTGLYVVWAGSFKLCALTHEGHAQVTSFAMRGDCIGLEGIAGRIHEGEALALEDSQVWVVPIGEADAASLSDWSSHLHCTMSRELARRQAAILLAHRSAEVRVASFLLDLSGRAAARGYSSTSIVLPMSRGDIGSCLGLKLETVSRTFSSLQANGLLHVQGRLVQLTNVAELLRRCGRGSQA